MFAPNPKREQEQFGLQHIDYMVLQPSQDIRDIAADHADEMPRTIGLFLKSLGVWDEDVRLVGYLLFEPGYIGALINLGHSSTLTRWSDKAS